MLILKGLLLFVLFVGGTGMLAEGDYATGLTALGFGVFVLAWPRFSKGLKLLLILGCITLWLLCGGFFWDWALGDYVLAASVGLVALVIVAISSGPVQPTRDKYTYQKEGARVGLGAAAADNAGEHETGDTGDSGGGEE